VIPMACYGLFIVAVVGVDCRSGNAAKKRGCLAKFDSN
jgi:hypothetical protein